MKCTCGSPHFSSYEMDSTRARTIHSTITDKYYMTVVTELRCSLTSILGKVYLIKDDDKNCASYGIPISERDIGHPSISGAFCSNIIYKYITNKVYIFIRNIIFLVVAVLVIFSEIGNVGVDVD